MSWTAINLWFVVLFISHFIFYRIGYSRGGRSVLREWKAWNDEVYGAECPHGNGWDDCPDCRH